MPKYSLEQIKESFVQKRDWERQFPLNYFVVRPFSFYLTYVVMRITQNPAKVAICGFSLGILGCFILACSSVWSVWPGIILVCLYSVSDAVDGNIARTTQNVTLFGKYLDGLLGDIIDGSYFFFLGLGLYFSGSGPNDPIINAWTGSHSQSVPLFLGSLIVLRE